MHQQWKTMIARCENTNRPEYSRYGGRGIKVCNSWHDFDKFKEWMVSSGYVINGIKRTQTIDRIDVNGDYCPDNCRLVNMKVQDNNKRNNIYVKYGDETHTLAEWSSIMNINYQTLCKRYNDLGWRGKKLFRPIMQGSEKDIPRITLTYKGKSTTIHKLSMTTGIKEATLLYRYHKGLRDDDLTKPVYRGTTIEYQGKQMTFMQLEKLSGINANTIKSRYCKGIRGSKLLEKPHKNQYK